MNKCLVELIGTFFLVLTVGLTVLSGQAGVLTSVTIAVTLMGLIYAGGHISGAHYNPAVTYGIMIRGRFDKEEAIAYVIAQVVGAIAAAIVAFVMVGSASVLVENRTAVELADFRTGVAIFFAEFLFTFALVFVILNVATADSTADNQYYGLAIAAVVLGGGYSVGWISGGSFNPAVTLGAAIMRILPWSAIWIHLIAEVLAGYVAARVFRLVQN